MVSVLDRLFLRRPPGHGFLPSPPPPPSVYEYASAAALSPTIRDAVSLLFRPTPQYPVNSAAATVVTSGLQYAGVTGSATWLLTKDSSIARLRLRAKQYSAALGLR